MRHGATGWRRSEACRLASLDGRTGIAAPGREWLVKGMGLGPCPGHAKVQLVARWRVVSWVLLAELELAAEAWVFWSAAWETAGRPLVKTY